MEISSSSSLPAGLGLGLEIVKSMSEIMKSMERQRNEFHKQIDQLRNIVVTQCKLTAVNPLSQEMAAGALSIKIGKRPRDLLNPKAVKYMQSVFSIKDAISKKESREISARFGVTVTQVREYFASQRTRVRKMVRLSREKAIVMSTSTGFHDVVSNDSEPMLPIEPVPLNSAVPSTEASPSNQDDVLPGLSDFEKQFVENVFSSMYKEETFSGQVKLMEWILRIENPSVLCWFLTKGGVMTLATWLSLAASEEQTSVLSVALKVLSHLPLHKALPVHMSAILQAINRLRFYKISDISNRARVLLSKWSKMLSKSQATRKPNGIKSVGLPEIDLRQRIGEIIEDESWKSSVNNPDLILVPLDGNLDDSRKMETPKLLTAPDDSNKKFVLGSATTHNKERRKVLLVEQPGHKTALKSQQVKAVPSGTSQARPITADEIQKQKLRAQYMQSHKRKSEGPKKPSLLTNDFLSASEAYLRPKLEAQKKARLLPPRNSKILELCTDQKPIVDEVSLPEKCRRVQIPWEAPREYQVNEAWEIGIGQNSKENVSQRTRMHREKETIYRITHDIPPNPKDPWDVEIDFDDTLTPVIPIEQLPEPDAEYADGDYAADGVEAPSDPQLHGNQNTSVNITPNIPSNSLQIESGLAEAEPDLELLAVLLKNPELVFALTSGQASGLSSVDTVKLLDMLKSSTGAGLLNGLAGKIEEQKVVEVSLPSPTPTPTRHEEVSLPSPTPPSRFEVSLPSPTPSINLGPSGWTSEAAKNPFSRHTVTASDRFQNTSTLQSQLPSALQPFLASSSSNVKPDNHQTFLPSDQTQTRHINHLPINTSSPYPRSLPGLSQQHYQLVPEPYVPDDSNRAMLRATHGLTHSSFSNSGNQNVFNPIARPESRVRLGSGSGPGSGAFPGPSWERNEIYPGGRKGLEPLSPQRSPARYQLDQHSHGYGQGHGHNGWNHLDQRGYNNGHPSDRNNRYPNSSGYRDRGWRGGGGGGGGNRRWQDDDRRR